MASSIFKGQHRRPFNITPSIKKETNTYIFPVRNDLLDLMFNVERCLQKIYEKINDKNFRSDVQFEVTYRALQRFIYQSHFEIINNKNEECICLTCSNETYKLMSEEKDEQIQESDENDINLMDATTENGRSAFYNKVFNTDSQEEYEPDVPLNQSQYVFDFNKK